MEAHDRAFFLVNGIMACTHRALCDATTIAPEDCAPTAARAAAATAAGVSDAQTATIDDIFPLQKLAQAIARLGGEANSTAPCAAGAAQIHLHISDRARSDLELCIPEHCVRRRFLKHPPRDVSAGPGLSREQTW